MAAHRFLEEAGRLIELPYSDGAVMAPTEEHVVGSCQGVDGTLRSMLTYTSENFI